MQKQLTEPHGPAPTKCRTCGVDLVIGDNWSANRQKKSCYQCRACATEACARSRRENPFSYMLSAAKHRAKKKGLEFDLDIDFLKSIDREVCPYLHIPLTQAFGRQKDGSKSLDRIDSNKGYTKDNVIICSWRANSLLKNASAKEMMKVCRNFLRILKEHTSEPQTTN